MKNKNKNKLHKQANNNGENDNLNEDKSKLYKDLDIINISIGSIFLVLYGVLINIEYLLGERSKLLDNINNTNYADNLEDLSEVPKIANLIYLVTTAIFVGIVWDAYNTIKSQNNAEPIEIENAYNSLVATLLFLLGTVINFQILNS